MSNQMSIHYHCPINSITPKFKKYAKNLDNLQQLIE